MKKNHKQLFPQRDNPIYQKLVRRPGEYLLEKIGDMQLELIQYGIIAYLSLTISSLAIWWYYRPPELESVIALGVFGVLMTAYFSYRFIKCGLNLRKSQFGYDGELYVSQYLDRAKDKDWRLFNDLQMSGYNIDHVIVASQGVFCIETKARRRKNNHMKVVVWDGKKVLVDGYDEEKELRQSKRNAVRLSEYLNEHINARMWVQPVLVYPGCFVINKLRHKKGTHAWVDNPEFVPGAIRKLPVNLDKKTQQRICAVLSKKCSHRCPTGN